MMLGRSSRNCNEVEKALVSGIPFKDGALWGGGVMKSSVSISRVLTITQVLW
jgi:hypothetical protein